MRFKEMITVVSILIVICLVAAGLVMLATRIRSQMTPTSWQTLGYTDHEHVNQRGWYRTFDGWRPGLVRHWLASEPIVVIEDMETGYCHEVTLENLCFRNERPW